MAMAFYAVGISFHVLEDPQMKLFFKHLRPDFKLPTRYKMAGPLLDKCYTREKKKVINAIKNEPYMTIVTDGWANPNKQSIVNFVLTSPRMSPVFWSSVATGGNQHTGEYMAERIEEVIQDIEVIMRPGAVCGVVTDNASNMRKAWEILMHNRPNLTCNGCGAHMMNLIMKDILGLATVTDVLDDAKWLSKYILNRYILLDHFDRIQDKLNPEYRRRLCLPVPTRWYTSEACMKSVQQNKHVIQAVLDDVSLDRIYKDSKRHNKLARARKLATDVAFWAKLDAVLLLLHPINEALAEFEKDGSYISAVFSQFRRISKDKAYVEAMDNSTTQFNFAQQEIKRFIASREKEFLTSSMKIGYLLDPCLDRSYMEDKEVDDTIKAAADMLATNEKDHALVSAELSQFVADKALWSEDDKKTNRASTPFNWWSRRNTTYQRLRPLALRLFCIPTSSAASERSWSIHGFIHSKRRNRLTAERVEKLVFLYTNHDGDDLVMYDSYPDAPRDDVDGDSEEVLPIRRTLTFDL